MTRGGWRDLAQAQHGLLTRAQLAALGVDRWAVRHRIATERWLALGPTVVSTTTGALSREQRKWWGVLHAGAGAVLGDLTAAEHLGLRNWTRDEITVLVDKENAPNSGIDGITFVQTRHSLALLRDRRSEIPCAAIEPAVLRFASRQRSHRTAEGVLAAAVQQQLTSPELLLGWVDRLRPLRGAPRFRVALGEIAGGAQSVAEIDVRRMCNAFRLRLPDRQTKRRDSSGRLRFTDCEWHLPNGHVIVLEVDGAFHMETEHWEDDLARQRRLSGPGRTIVRCSARELRDDPDVVARDLRALGVPAA
ncbi:hypothetical protein [Nocardioides montaniterrae]